MSFSFSNSDNVGNQSSKYNWWLLQQLVQEGKNQPFCTIVLWLITDFSSIHEKIIYHSWLSNLHHIFRSIFFGLYCHTPLLPLAFAGIIYSSTHCTSSYLTFKQFCHASSSNGLILNISFLFLGSFLLSLVVLHPMWRKCTPKNWPNFEALLGFQTCTLKINTGLIGLSWVGWSQKNWLFLNMKRS